MGGTNKMRGVGRVLENSFLYTFSSLLVKAIGFLLLPVYTLFLTPDDYGITNLVSSFTGVATFIVTFSLHRAIIRFYTDLKDDREKLKRFYGTTVLFVFLSGCVFVGFMFLFRVLLIRWFFEGVAFFPFVVIALLGLIFACLHTVHQSILQGMQAGKRLTVINLVVFFFNVGFNLTFISVFKMGAAGVLLSSLLVNLFYVIYMLYDLRKSNLIVFCMDKTILRGALKYSIPLMPHNLSTSIASFASRVFINQSATLTTVGLYSVAMQFGNIIDMIQSSVNRAFAPWFYDTMNREGDTGKKEAVIFSRFMLILYSLIYMGIGLFSSDVLILMTTERYHSAWTAIPIMVAAFSVKSIYYFYINVLFYYKQAANKIFIATITGSLADIILASMLVKSFGMYGAAIAFLIAKIIVVTIVVMMSKMYDDIGYRVTDMLEIIVPSLLFMGAGLYFSYTKYHTIFSWVNLLYKVGVLLGYLAFVYLTNRSAINNLIGVGKIRRVVKSKMKRSFQW